MLIATLSALSQQVSDAERQYREAQRMQQIDGDLPGAIKMYQNIVAKTTDRAVKAKALWQLAAASETLGQKAEDYYQQIVRDFPEQPAARDANAKLAALHSTNRPGTYSKRKLEFGKGVENVVATDGEQVIYWDSAQIHLFIGDVAGKSRRQIFQTRPEINHGEVPHVITSRDLKWLFLGYAKARQGEVGFGLVKSDGTGLRDFIINENGVRLPNNQPDYVSWSWDNRYLLLCKVRQDGAAHLLKVSVADGSVEDLSGNESPSIGKAEFSPDGKFIAYATGTIFSPGEVRLISSAGGPAQTLAEKAVLLDWTPDGRYVLLGETPANRPLISNSGLKVSALAIENGRASGQTVPIDSSLAGNSPVTRVNGSLIYSATTSSGQLMASSLDERDRLKPWEPLKVYDVLGGGYPDWSLDNKQIVYVSGRDSVRVLNMTTSVDREIYHGTDDGLIVQCIWARSSLTVLCGRVLTRQDTDIISISPETLHAETVVSLPGPRILQGSSADDRTLFTFGESRGRVGSFAWERGKEDETTNIPPAPWKSNDGHWIYSLFGTVEQRLEIRIRHVDPDSEYHSLVVTKTEQRRTPGIVSFAIRFTPDSRWVVYHDKDPDSKDGLYRVSVQGGEPERLGSYPSSEYMGFLAISPNGRRFLTSFPGLSKEEFWVLDNVSPKASGNPVAKTPTK
jgi:WD40 repeat protein